MYTEHQKGNVTLIWTYGSNNHRMTNVYPLKKITLRCNNYLLIFYFINNNRTTLWLGVTLWTVVTLTTFQRGTWVLHQRGERKGQAEWKEENNSRLVNKSCIHLARINLKWFLIKSMLLNLCFCRKCRFSKAWHFL